MAAFEASTRPRRIGALCRDARAGLRQRHPEASARERQLRLGALTIERSPMIAAFGWDREREGR